MTRGAGDLAIAGHFRQMDVDGHGARVSFVQRSDSFTVSAADARCQCAYYHASLSTRPARSRRIGRTANRAARTCPYLRR